jgi:PAS domain S-box-containing protein
MAPSVVQLEGSQPDRPVGFYTYDVARDTWTWSDGVYQLHGYSPREIPATTEALLHHKHPDDRARADAVLQEAMRDGGEFSCYHRIVDKRGTVRTVLSVGRGISDDHGTVLRVEGYFVDLTDVRRDEVQAGLAEALEGITRNRETIDLAKGIVMLARGCDGDEAFAYLRRCSQDANVKLNELARRLVDAVGAEVRGSDDVVAFLTGLRTRA